MIVGGDESDHSEIFLAILGKILCFILSSVK